MPQLAPPSPPAFNPGTPSRLIAERIASQTVPDPRSPVGSRVCWHFDEHGRTHHHLQGGDMGCGINAWVTRDAWPQTPHYRSAVRFARCFCAAWQRIPDDTRAELQRYWRSGHDWAPFVLLVPQLPHPFESNATTIAFTLEGGWMLAFSLLSLDRFEDAAVEAVIAHELAHVALIAEGAEFFTHDDCEDAADQLAQRWGFDVAAARQRSEQLFGADGAAL